MFNRHWHLKRHYANCYERTKYIFPEGFYKYQETIFDKLESLTIYLPESDRYYPTCIVWDMEAVLMKTSPSSTNQMIFLCKHIPVSVSISSNVEGFCEPNCFVDTSSNNLISKMICLIEISSTNLSRLKLKYDYVFQDLDGLLSKYTVDPESDSNFSDTSTTEFTIENSLSSNTKTHFFKILDLQKKFELYLSQIPVVGFNSGKYDINLIKEEIMSYIARNFLEKDIHTIKKKILI